MSLADDVTEKVKVSCPGLSEGRIRKIVEDTIQEHDRRDRELLKDSVRGTK